MVRTLFTYHDLSIEVESHPGDELIEHMMDTLLGMPGGFQYYHTNISDRLHSLDENYFLYLRKSGKMLGSVGFCGREKEVLGFRHEVWMVRYFSIKAPMRTTPSAETSNQGDTIEKRTTVLGRFIKPIVENPSYLRTNNKDSIEPGMIFGIIDKTNYRSRRFAIQAGLESIGRINFFPFSRFHPKLSSRMHPLQDKEMAGMIKLLNTFYQDFTLLTTENLFKGHDYYVIKEQNEIIAGLQIYEVTWRVVSFGSGFMNRIIGLMSRIPYIRRRINPKNLKLLALDGLYFREGNEDALYELIESVLAARGVYVSLLIMDEKSKLNRLFEEREHRGIVYKLLGKFKADVMARFIHIPDNVQQFYREHPTYISSYDNS